MTAARALELVKIYETSGELEIILEKIEREARMGFTNTEERLNPYSQKELLNLGYTLTRLGDPLAHRFEIRWSAK